MNRQHDGEVRGKTILFLSHREQQCGVYQFGLNIAKALESSKVFRFIFEKCSDASECHDIVRRTQPAGIIYNYHPTTMPWLRNNILKLKNIPNIGITHEVTQRDADLATNHFFDYHIAPDPTLVLKNPIVFKTGRLVLSYQNEQNISSIPTIGSFGFGTPGKGFDKLVSTVQEEFDEAIVKLHIPFATFGDADGISARKIATQCQLLVRKPGIKLIVDHDFMDDDQVLDFLAANTLNAFLYEENNGRGISSVIDYALAVKRPIAITRSNMFRHITDTRPSICIENRTLKEIIADGVEPLSSYVREWCTENLLWDYERIVQTVLERRLPTRPSLLRRMVRKITRRRTRQNGKTDRWGPGSSRAKTARSNTLRTETYRPSFQTAGFNRILDNAARELYHPAIEFLFEAVPEMMKRKIPAANIQQAFVFDTVVRLNAGATNSKLLCVGSFEDTAAASLKEVGFRLEEVDPLLNYDLETFCARPTTQKGSYNIVFSTSVIEHVRNDERFISLIGELLAPGGVAILTCDYNNAYIPGDRIPQEDFRFYTQRDLKNRLLSHVPECLLVDQPHWDCDNPDFVYAGCRYTFATIVFRKKKI
jgi:SAM-dependent methyltransferase